MSNFHAANTKLLLYHFPFLSCQLQSSESIGVLISLSACPKMRWLQFSRQTEIIFDLVYYTSIPFQLDYMSFYNTENLNLGLHVGLGNKSEVGLHLSSRTCSLPPSLPPPMLGLQLRTLDYDAPNEFHGLKNLPRRLI